MRRFIFLIQRIFTMDYKSLNQTIRKVHEKTGRSRIALFFDITHCAMKYGCGYNDYLYCEFYNLTEEQRATYITRGVNNALVRQLNDENSFHYLGSKAEFYQRYAAFIHREWLDLTCADFAQFQAFVKKHPVVIIKPIAGTGGKGVEKLDRNDFSSDREMYDYILSSGSLMTEEVILQHPDLNRIYPHAINTYRIVTILTDNHPQIFYTLIRCGNHGAVVDNLHSGGMFSPVDPDTGKILYPACDKAQNIYDRHPETGVQFVGYKLPCWQEALDMCRQASLVTPAVRYVGWDVAVSPDGVQLVEGNFMPGYDLSQMPAHTPDKIGLLPRAKELIRGKQSAEETH